MSRQASTYHQVAHRRMEMLYGGRSDADMIRQAALVPAGHRGTEKLFGVRVRESRRTWWGGKRWSDWCVLTDQETVAWDEAYARAMLDHAVDNGWVSSHYGRAQAILDLEES